MESHEFCRAVLKVARIAYLEYYSKASIADMKAMRLGSAGRNTWFEVTWGIDGQCMVTAHCAYDAKAQVLHNLVEYAEERNDDR